MTAILFHLTNTLTGQLVVTGAEPEVITSTSMHYLGIVLDGKKPVIAPKASAEGACILSKMGYC